MTTPPEPPSLDLTRPLRGVEDLEQLVAYVYAADPRNETDWLEWKTGLDLTTAKGRFDASRHILGFSNRAPGPARRHAAGLAFLVLGVEPGNAPGQVPMDPADLTAGIRTYVGTQGPVWAPLWVSFQGVLVLVVTIEAPQAGDPIHTLQRTFEGSQEGTIFVRHPGTTDRASSSDVMMLSQRVRDAQARVDVEVSTQAGPICVLDASGAAVEAWISDERDALIRPLQKARMERMADDQRTRLEAVTGVGRFAELPANLHALVEPIVGRMVPETRSEESYVTQVESYLDAARSKLAGAAVRGFLNEPCCELVVVVRNPTDANIPGVALEVTFGDEVTLDIDKSSLDFVPKAPRAWGPRREGGFDLSPFVRPSSLVPSVLPAFPSLERDHTISGQRVVYHAGHLRPAATYVSRTVALVITDPGLQQITARWAATSAALNGVVEGCLEVALGPVRPIAAFVPHQAG